MLNSQKKSNNTRHTWVQIHKRSRKHNSSKLSTSIWRQYKLASHHHQEHDQQIAAAQHSVGYRDAAYSITPLTSNHLLVEPIVKQTSRRVQQVTRVQSDYWQVHQRSRLTSFKDCSVLLPASLPVPTSSTGVFRGCCTPSCTGSTYLSESHTSSESSCSAASTVELHSI